MFILYQVHINFYCNSVFYLLIEKVHYVNKIPFSVQDELHFVVEPKAEATVTNPGTINTTSNDEEAIQSEFYVKFVCTI